MLRRIARVRRDLVAPVALIQCKVMWTGAPVGKLIARRTLQDLVRQWRALGFFVPITRHAKVSCSGRASPSLKALLCNTRALSDCIDMDEPPACFCSKLLADMPEWPSVTVDGKRHIAAPQSCVPWPRDIEHLAYWPASITLQPTYEDVVASARDSFRVPRTRCRISDDNFLAESCAASYADSVWSHVEGRMSTFPISSVMYRRPASS
jgi:hypothetical protein